VACPPGGACPPNRKLLKKNGIFGQNSINFFRKMRFLPGWPPKKNLNPGHAFALEGSFLEKITDQKFNSYKKCQLV
jgi:hypothetical protein